MSEICLFRQNIFRKVIPRKYLETKTGLVLFFLIGLLLCPVALSAQTGSSGQITGTVTDQNGAVVPDATITVTQVDTGSKRTVTTNADGNYAIANLPIGIYR